MRKLLTNITLLLLAACTDGAADGGPTSHVPATEPAGFRIQEEPSAPQGLRRFRVLLSLEIEVAAIQGAISGEALAACMVLREPGEPSPALWLVNDLAPDSTKFAAFAAEAFDVSSILTISCDVGRLRPGLALDAVLSVAGTETGEALSQASLPATQFLWTGAGWIKE